MASEQSPTPAAGWYPDPVDPGLQRLWDGERWSDQTRSGTSASPIAQRPGSSESAPPPPPPLPPEPRRSGPGGWSGGSATGLGVVLLVLLMIGGCGVVGLVPLFAFRSSNVEVFAEADMVEPMPVPTMTTMPAPMFAPDVEVSTTAVPGVPGLGPDGVLMEYGSTPTVPAWFEGDVEPSVFDITVGEPVDRTEEILTANPLNAEPLPGVVHVGVPVTVVLSHSLVEPLSVEGSFDWQIVGGATFSVYRPIDVGGDEFGCGALDDNLTMTELNVGEEVGGTVCIAIPAADFDHVDTRVVLAIGQNEPITWSR